MRKIERTPTHPGEILREEFLKPLGLTQVGLAKDIDTTFRTVNEIVNEKRNISPEMAIRLAKYFGTSEELWLNLQTGYNLYKARKKMRLNLKKIKPLRRARAVTGK